MPKQFVKLFDNHSLFQKTLQRNAPFCKEAHIITNKEHYFIALDQIEEIDFLHKKHRFILEPFGKNTAPAIAFACFDLDPEELVFVTPSDHLIKDVHSYKKTIETAKKLAKDGKLVTFGIVPDEANTGYGYIEADGNSVKRFHEKPDMATAQRYLETNKQNLRYFWNAGMFLFQAGTYLSELQQYAPKVYENALKAYENAINQHNMLSIKEHFMNTIPDISIDYAVMEKSDNIAMVPADIGWNDVGSFDALSQELSGSETIELQSKNNFALADKPVALVDVEDLIIIDTKDALLVTKKGSSQKIKELIPKIQKNFPHLASHHIEVHRPWGTYEVLIEEDNYKLKKIIVKPGKRLSLQKHYHRSEHWIVVSGTAEVTVGDKTYLVRSNESTYIKLGEVHRLANPGKIPVILIEAQVGEYTGEDDIVRIEDDFRRA